MDRKMLRDDQWERIEQLLPGKASDRGVTARDNRRFVEAVLWIMRTGSPWREKGVFERVAQAMRSDADMEQLLIDSTIVRAHQHSAGAQAEPLARKSAARGRADNQTACRGGCPG